MADWMVPRRNNSLRWQNIQSLFSPYGLQNITTIQGLVGMDCHLGFRKWPYGDMCPIWPNKEKIIHGMLLQSMASAYGCLCLVFSLVISCVKSIAHFLILLHNICWRQICHLWHHPFWFNTKSKYERTASPKINEPNIWNFWSVVINPIGVPSECHLQVEAESIGALLMHQEDLNGLLVLAWGWAKRLVWARTSWEAGLFWVALLAALHSLIFTNTLFMESGCLVEI